MWYDLLTLGILMYAMFRGAMKGIVWQLATIAALLMCFFFSGSLSHVIAPFIRVEEPLNKWIAMLVLYLGFSFVSFGVARVMHEAASHKPRILAQQKSKSAPTVRRFLPCGVHGPVLR